ncbi:hypothetical protein GQ55_6G097000 [Panicum hallii var. hallii]|uniref:Disease resistance N-terminal domain-containing protein n=1 Tax=Panicum hallii var. hallii TaxID=1504633 RepID=A0A2T7D5K7_9POAL|nr:hypothetical protein GQ55_6G097000 [Panicum hallii var. hallii]
MADVAGLLASAIVTQVGSKLGSVIGDQVSMLCCFEDDMVDMKETLETIGATMEDAEKRSIKEKEVQLWLKRLKNAALDISDMIDEFQPDSKQTDGNKTGILSCLDIAPKITMANKMKKMRDQLEKIKEDHLKFKFEPYQRNDIEYLERDNIQGQQRRYHWERQRKKESHCIVIIKQQPRRRQNPSYLWAWWHWQDDIGKANFQ